MPFSKTIAVAFAASTLALGACATTPEPTKPLSGSTWRLVEFQSMDDAQGTTRPSNRDQYTVEFNADGTAYLKLDCNRGRSSWNATRTGAMQGSLEFGQLSSTMALCNDGGLSERLGQQLGFVRSYVMRDGRLNMSLLADGGILVWERTSTAP